MSSWFVLDFEADWAGQLGQSWFILDYEANYGAGTEFTWGEITNAVASERMTVQYAVEGGTVVHAELRMVGLTLPMEVFPGTLELDLPGDVPDGNAAIYVTVLSDAEVELTYTQAVYIVGVVGAPQPSHRAGGMPHPGPELFRTSSLARVTSTARVRVRGRTRSEAFVWTLGSTRQTARLQSAVVVSTGGTIRHPRRAQLPLEISVSATMRRVAEGPIHEEELVLLLL